MVLCKGAKFREYQTMSGSDEPTVTGEIVENKKMSDMYGIKNLSAKMWIASYDDGHKKQLLQNMGTIVSDDLKLDFGNGLFAHKKVS